MTRLLIIILLTLTACGTAVDENGLGSETKAFPKEMVDKYPQFDLANTQIGFCTEGDFHFCYIDLKDYTSGSDPGQLIALTNDVYSMYHRDFDFSEVFIRTRHVEFRFESIPVKSAELKTDTATRSPHDTIVYIR